MRVLKFWQSEDPDEKYDLLFQISDQADDAGLRFLIGLAINRDVDEDDRMAAIEALKPHVGLRGNAYAFTKLLDWLESGDQADGSLTAGACQLLRFCGYANHDWRERIIRLLLSDLTEVARETLITDIGIHGKSHFTERDLSAIAQPENRKYVEFARREWSRQK